MVLPGNLRRGRVVLGIFVCVLKYIICTVKKKKTVQKSLQFSMKTEPPSLPWLPAVPLLSPEQPRLPSSCGSQRRARLDQPVPPGVLPLPCLISAVVSSCLCASACFTCSFQTTWRQFHVSILKVISSFQESGRSSCCPWRSLDFDN